MKVMVTGGAGFIGSHVVDACLAEGHEVSVVDDLSTGKRENVDPRAKLHVVDLCDAEAMREVFDQERPERICHLAAKANVRESVERPILYTQVNEIGSLILLELAKDFDCPKIVYASTGGAVYGEPEYLPVDEKHPIKPISPYGATKHHVEHFLYIYNVNYDLDYTVLRFPNVYGPRQDPNGEAGVIAIWTAEMLDGDEPIIYGSGEQERDFVYVGEIARANVLALTRGGGQILNLGSGVGTSINCVFHHLKEITSFPQDGKHGPAQPGDVFQTSLDAEKAQEVLGWQNEIGLREGLERTVAYFREQRE